MYKLDPKYQHRKERTVLQYVEGKQRFWTSTASLTYIDEETTDAVEGAYLFGSSIFISSKRSLLYPILVIPTQDRTTKAVDLYFMGHKSYKAFCRDVEMSKDLLVPSSFIQVRKVFIKKGFFSAYYVCSEDPTLEVRLLES